MSTQSKLFQAGREALQQGRYREAVQSLEEFFHTCTDADKVYIQAQMCLVKAYQRNNQLPHALTLCQRLASHPSSQINSWARLALKSLTAAQATKLQAPLKQPD